MLQGSVGKFLDGWCQCFSFTGYFNRFLSPLIELIDPTVARLQRSLLHAPHNEERERPGAN